MTYTAEDIARLFGVTPEEMHHHELDLVTEKAKRERADYIRLLERMTLVLDTVDPRRFVVTLDNRTEP